MKTVCRDMGSWREGPVYKTGRRWMCRWCRVSTHKGRGNYGGTVSGVQFSGLVVFVEHFVILEAPNLLRRRIILFRYSVWTWILVCFCHKFWFCRRAILVVGHGDPLQILQTVLNAAKQQTETECSNLESRIQAVRVPPILSQHRKFALLTGELRAVI